ncbi:unnamed protein product [Enterobius vermicularis]|uniref:Proteasomal ubiquitin receptor ADRM1 homolog n=1 Tax=Enterobius vermicularis TaxID=51028 RepID=A0A0N4VJ68_ENTVE|nr:unnamed protein product [Enterobius vermicularis]
MSVMFANSRTTQTNAGHLVEFKAGRSILQPGSTPEKRKVVADKTKGLVFIKQSNDQLMHFCWENRETGQVPDDLIIFPGDTEFIRVKECTDGRVYMLKFKSSDERRLFWMQEGETDKDDEYCKKVNEILNNPPAPRQSGRAGGERNISLGGALAAFNSSENELSALSNLDQSQLMQLLSLMNNGAGSTSDGANFLPQLPLISDGAQQATEGSASTRVATPSNTPANGTVSGSGGQGNAVQLSQLKDIIASIGNPARAKNRTFSSCLFILSQIQPFFLSIHYCQTRVELSDVLNNDNVGETVKNNGDQLMPHLPKQDPIYTPQQELEQTVRTPQFRQAVDVFGHAFQTGQLAPVLSQFGMPPEVTTAAQSGDLVNFAQKLTEAETQKKTGESAGSSDAPCPQSQPSSSEVDAHIAREAEEEETNESSLVKEPEPKRGFSFSAMAWCCSYFFTVVGHITVWYTVIQLLLKVYRCVYPYFFAKPLYLLSVAGAKWAVITGSTDGIGRAYAFEFARRGFNILLISRNQSRLDEVKEGIEKESKVEVRTIQFDFSCADLEEYQKRIISQLTAMEVGVLVNNVGVAFEYPDVLHMVEGGLKKHVETNIVNTLPTTLLCAAVLPQMVERNSGIIINVASGASFHKMSMWSTYSAAKKYVSWFTGILQKEYARTHIFIQLVCPLLVATKMAKARNTSFFIPSAEDYVKSAVNTIGIQKNTNGFFSHQIQGEAICDLPEPIASYILDNRSFMVHKRAINKKLRDAKSE